MKEFTAEEISEMSIKQKLFFMKQELPILEKDKTNERTKSKYTSIDKILENLNPILIKYEVILMHTVLGDVLRTSIECVHSSLGDGIHSEMNMRQGISAQEKGAEITYFRRITLSALFGIQTEEDTDGEESKKATPENKKLSENITAMKELKSRINSAVESKKEIAPKTPAKKIIPKKVTLKK